MSRAQTGQFVYMRAFTDPAGTEHVRTSYEGDNPERRWNFRPGAGKPYSTLQEAEDACQSEDEYITYYKVLGNRLIYQGFYYQERTY